MGTALALGRENYLRSGRYLNSTNVRVIHAQIMFVVGIDILQKKNWFFEHLVHVMNWCISRDNRIQQVPRGAVKQF